MRTISYDSVVEAVAEMSIEANRYLPDDVHRALTNAHAGESSEVGREILRQLLENAELARESGLPLCQDTGLAVIFAEMGEDLRLEGGSLRDAINDGVRKGYADGFLRKSACDPMTRANTKDNTPAVIHFDIVPGDRLTLRFMAKGGGSENMSRVTMLAPAQGWPGIRKFVLNRVAEAGPNPCPPIIIGIGVGGTFDYAPLLAKKALMRELDDTHPDPKIAEMEAELLAAVNALGIGPMGLGGDTTCLGVKIRMEPCHIASLPLAVNIQCHSARHKEVEL